jgi:GT2 family glycosyltransferase
MEQIMTHVSVAIRSVAVNALLVTLLRSIEAQTVCPDEIVIVIPNDASLGSEWTDLVKGCAIPARIALAPRGMVTQRAEGIRRARGELVLLLDDDLVLCPTFVHELVGAARREGAACVVPFVVEPKPRLGAVLSFFAIAVPYRGYGGIRQLASGGFSYPTEPLPAGTIAETEGGRGAAILVHRKWALERELTGDTRLQMKSNPYALREDGAFVYAMHLAGGRVVTFNAGPYVHGCGSTARNSKRLLWAYEAGIRNNFIFWKTYVYPRQATFGSRARAIGNIARHLVGVTVLSMLSALKAKSIRPIYGVLKGYCQLLRSDT